MKGHMLSLYQTTFTEYVHMELDIDSVKLLQSVL